MFGFGSQRPSSSASRIHAICGPAARSRGLHYLECTWDDSTRTVGTTSSGAAYVSSGGPHIMDATIENLAPAGGGDSHLRVFRAGSNWDDKFFHVPVSKFNVVANDAGGKRVVSLDTYLGGLDEFNAGRAGVFKAFPGIMPDTVVKVRYQVVLVEGDTEYMMCGRSYRDGQSLVIGGNTQATTPHNSGRAYQWIKFGAVQGDNDEHGFMVEATKFKDLKVQEERGAEREAALKAGLATSVEVGPEGDPESLNVNFVIQVPVMSNKPKPARRFRGVMAGSGGGGAAGAYDDSDDDWDGDGDWDDNATAAPTMTFAVACAYDDSDEESAGAGGMFGDGDDWDDDAAAAPASSAAPRSAVPAPAVDVATAGRVSISKTTHRKAPELTLNNDIVLDTGKDITATVMRVVVIPKGATDAQVEAAAHKCMDLLSSLFSMHPATDLREESKAAEVAAAAEAAAPAAEVAEAAAPAMNLGLTQDVAPKAKPAGPTSNLNNVPSL